MSKMQQKWCLCILWTVGLFLLPMGCMPQSDRDGDAAVADPASPTNPPSPEPSIPGTPDEGDFGPTLHDAARELDDERNIPSPADAVAAIPPDDAEPDAGRVEWGYLQFRFFPSFFEPWSQTFFEGQGIQAVEIQREGEFWVLLRREGGPGEVDFGRLLRGTLEQDALTRIHRRVEAARPDFQESRSYACNPCGGECTFQGVAIKEADRVIQVRGNESFGPNCDPGISTVPPDVAELAQELRTVLNLVASGGIAAEPAENPARVRLGVTGPEEIEPLLSDATLDSATDWPFQDLPLAAIIDGPKAWGYWWEYSLEGEPAARVWPFCREKMESGTPNQGAGPFLAKEDGVYFAIACAVDLPSGTWSSF